MSTTSTPNSAAIRARLNHPIIDSDGHIVEFAPAIFDYLKQVAGTQMVERYQRSGPLGGLLQWYQLSPEERRDRRVMRPPWWGLPTKNTLDRATAMLPKLLYKRLDEMGIDFTVLFPSLGIFLFQIEDDELRGASCRAFNTFHADIFREYADRMTPAAIIPMHTPAEAIAELEHAANVLGMKVAVMGSHVRRPIPLVAREAPQAARSAIWLDTFCLDSDHDYDPVWAKCVELKVVPAFHGGGMGWGSRTSISNFVYNHIGHFAAAGEAVCKALFLSGVTRRFPTLKCIFLEGGVGWACSLYADLIRHWNRRNATSLVDLDPANLDRALLANLIRRYGEGLADSSRLTELAMDSAMLLATEEDAEMLDEWAPCLIEKAEDIRDLFVRNFYFGCEADDPMNALAFNTKVNPFGACLNAVLGSDIGHWDVADLTMITAEAHELVDEGIFQTEHFRDFVFTNPATLWAGTNPAFFRGTVVEHEVAKIVPEM